MIQCVTWSNGYQLNSVSVVRLSVFCLVYAYDTMCDLIYRILIELWSVVRLSVLCLVYAYDTMCDLIFRISIELCKCGLIACLLLGVCLWYNVWLDLPAINWYRRVWFDCLTYVKFMSMIQCVTWSTGYQLDFASAIRLSVLSLVYAYNTMCDLIYRRSIELCECG
jgi:hypothetical protein